MRPNPMSGGSLPGKERNNMHEMGGMATNPAGGSTGRAPSPYFPAPAEMAAYAAEVKRLTNYEVWRNAESALLALMPGQEPGDAGWWNLRILLDELNWRFSGLEGAGSASNQIPMKLYSN